MKKSGLACPCGKSTDAYAIQENGWGRCFGQCGGRNFPPGGRTDDGTKDCDIDAEQVMEKSSKATTPFSSLADFHKAWPERGFLKETLEKYKVQLNTETAKYPRFDSDGNHVGNKVRRLNPDGKNRFFFEGDKEAMKMFGVQAFPEGGKMITITEGQDDAMAAYQMMGSKYPCISVDSASSAKEDVKNNFEYINSFETIVLNLDNDEPGRKAAKEVGSLFALGKVKILTTRAYKDANDYLINKKTDAYVREWWSAPVLKVDGLKLGSDMWQEIIERKEHFQVEYPFTGLNKLTYGLRLSEFVVVTADTGVGKTSVLKHIEHKLLTDPTVIEKNYGVGFLHLEEPNGDTALGLLSIHNAQPYHLPDCPRPTEDIRQAYDDVLNNNRVVIWDHFGSNSVDAVLNKIRHMAALGCKYIVLDHLSIVVSDQAGDERKQLDEIATKSKTLCMELDICLIAVIHTNRQGQIRGTAGVEQLANIIIRLERDKTEANEWRRNITKVSVEKNRFCGYTGPASYLWYNKDTARLIELEEEAAMVFEAGGVLDEMF